MWVLKFNKKEDGTTEIKGTAVDQSKYKSTQLIRLCRLGEEDQTRIWAADQGEETGDTKLSEAAAQRLNQNRIHRISWGA